MQIVSLPMWLPEPIEAELAGREIEQLSWFGQILRLSALAEENVC